MCIRDREQLEGLRQAVQGFLYGEGPASYQQEFQCWRLLDQITAQLPEKMCIRDSNLMRTACSRLR